MKRIFGTVTILGLTIAPALAHHASRHAWRQAEASQGQEFTAKASFYGGGPRRYEPNARTANGEIFNMWDMTAAHRSLPMGTRLRLTYAGKSVVVRINDRGPFKRGRIVDLSWAAAQQLGIHGLATVELWPLAVGEMEAAAGEAR